MSVLLSTKFFPPPLPAGFVARPQLLEILDETFSHRLTLVSAPAGAGKTTLISAWTQSVRKKGAMFGWLSLDEGDNDSSRFWEYLAACFEEGGAQLGPGMLLSGSRAQMSGEGYPLEDIPTTTIQGGMRLNKDFVLILDDYHLIQNPEIHAALRRFLEHLPPLLHIILLARSDPPLELARLRVREQLAELRMEHLRFSDEEAAVFLKKTAGIQLMDADIAVLNDRTEGWIAGLQMAAISLRGRQDLASFVRAFAGSHRFVFDYLLEEVLNRQTPQVRQFLLKTSVLDRLSAPLCDAVAETGGAARGLLDALEKANLFLTSLDEERDWYRYHHLFADLLQLLLEQNYPGLAAELHRRACGWYEAQGMIPAALHHALSAGDVELAARLVSANVLALVEHAELTPILLQMDTTPRWQRESIPWLEVAYAWALAYAGQMERTHAALGLAERQLDTLPENERDRITGHISAVRGYLAWVNGSQPAAVGYAETAERLLPVEEIAVRSLNLTTLGNALTQFEASPRAVEVLEQAVSLARQAGQSHVFMPAASALAYAYFNLGRLHKAHTVCQEAVEVAKVDQQRTGQPIYSAASVYAILSGILAEQGEMESCLQAGRRGLALSELWGQADTIQICLLYLANGLSLARDFDGAVRVIQRARKLAQKVSSWFVWNVDQIELRIWLDMGNLDQAIRCAQEAVAPLPVALEARLLVQQNLVDKALALLALALPDAQRTSVLETIRILVIQALAYFLKREQAQACMVLKKALELAELENCVGIFLRQGDPMEKLLRLARAKSICPEFSRKLLTAFEAQHKPTHIPDSEALIEPLSERELEILRLLNGPLSTPEIAESLFVSTNTVRTHIKNIYNKLGVHGRSAAVRRAGELRLLSSRIDRA